MNISYSEEEVAHQKIDIDDDDFENREIIATKTTVGVETIHAVYEDGKETIADRPPFRSLPTSR